MQFVLSVDDDGTYMTVHKVSDVMGAPDDRFAVTNVSVGDTLDLHLDLGGGPKVLVRVALTDDVVPRFSSVEQADAWLASRSGVIVA